MNVTGTNVADILGACEEAIGSSVMSVEESSSIQEVMSESDEKMELIQQLRKHNEQVLAEHKRQLEEDFQSQVQSLVSTLKASVPELIRSQQQSEMYQHTRPARTPLTPALIDKQNERVLSAARSTSYHMHLHFLLLSRLLSIYSCFLFVCTCTL